MVDQIQTPSLLAVLTWSNCGPSVATWLYRLVDLVSSEIAWRSYSPGSTPMDVRIAVPRDPRLVHRPKSCLYSTPQRRGERIMIQPGLETAALHHCKHPTDVQL